RSVFPCCHQFASRPVLIRRGLVVFHFLSHALFSEVLAAPAACQTVYHWAQQATGPTRWLYTSHLLVAYRQCRYLAFCKTTDWHCICYFVNRRLLFLTGEGISAAGMGLASWRSFEALTKGVRPLEF